MKVKDKRVLITGAGGFIGSHITEELVRRGAIVTSFVRYNSRNDWGMIEELPTETRNAVKVVAGDLKDSDAVRESCKDIDIIFHLGALIAIPYSYIHPRDHIETNVLGTLNVLIGAKEHGVKKIIHTSTSEVYGTAQYVPIDEKHPLQGQSPYSASKIGADKIAESFHLSYGLPIVTVRPFNTFGPRQSARAVIPTIITQALTSQRILLGSLTPKRDFTFVKDTVRGMILAAESDNSIGHTINLGTGISISIGELAANILRIMGLDYEIVTDKKRIRPEKSEVMELAADISKAEKVLGWKPQVDLDTGLRTTIKHIKSNIEKYKANLYNI
jgi:dTDP-glucose 4,6-dehydratase